MKALRIIGNIVWLLFGIFTAFLWFVGGAIICCTFVGVPFGIQAFKIARLNLMPFGIDVVPTQRTFGCVGLALNLFWIFVVGWWLALGHLIAAFTLGCFFFTVIAIPFALQHLKLAKVALMPFGMEIVSLEDQPLLDRQQGRDS